MKLVVEFIRVAVMVTLAIVPLLLLIGATFTGHKTEAAFGTGLWVVTMAVTRPGTRLSVWRLY